MMQTAFDAYSVKKQNSTFEIQLFTTDFLRPALEINIRISIDLLLCIDKEGKTIYSKYAIPGITNIFWKADCMVYLFLWWETAVTNSRSRHRWAPTAPKRCLQIPAGREFSCQDVCSRNPHRHKYYIRL